MNYAVTNGKEQYKIIVVILSHLLLGVWESTDIDKAWKLYYISLSLFEKLFLVCITYL